MVTSGYVYSSSIVYSFWSVLSKAFAVSKLNEIPIDSG